MASPAQQQSWRTELARRQNAIPFRGSATPPNSPETENTAPNEPENNEPPIQRPSPRGAVNQAKNETKPATKSIAKISQKISMQLMRILATSGFATFGISWIGLMFYTLIKDLLQTNRLADPGDLAFLFLPSEEISKMPEEIKGMSRLLIRLLIYPLGALVLTIYLSLIALLVAVIF